MVFPKIRHLGAICVAVSLAWIPNLSKSESFQSETIWRVPENDSVNSLYIFLRYHGIQVQYSELHERLLSQASTQRISLLTLKNVAESYGLTTQIVSCEPSQLSRYVPGITVLNSTRFTSSSFALIFGSTTDERFRLIINGGSAAVERVPTEQFARTWSGAVLIPQRSSDIPTLAICLLCGVLLTIGFWYARMVFAKRGKQQ
jgi:ABC-type bacteriocin/lantibiotic exporter with double-glycine peptidase domain